LKGLACQGLFIDARNDFHLKAYSGFDGAWWRHGAPSAAEMMEEA